MNDYMNLPDKLKGKNIFIGKDASTGRIMISVLLNGKNATALFGANNSVPNSVSRCLPDKGMAHLEISISEDGKVIAKNLKEQNVTYIQDSEIISKSISADVEFKLGKDKYPIKLSSILKVGEKIVAVSEPEKTQEFDISHLEQVWETYHSHNIELQRRSRRQNMQGRIPMFFTMGAGALSSIAFACGWGENVKVLCIVLTVIGLIIMVYAFLITKNDTSIEDRERFTEEFQDNYICPNPKCGKYLGSYSYKLMKRQYSMCCPHCKCKFVEK